MSNHENAMPESVQTKIVRCPACGGPSLYATGNPYRPFCSPRCKNLDFGAWASEAFKLPVNPAQERPTED